MLFCQMQMLNFILFASKYRFSKRRWGELKKVKKKIKLNDSKKIT